MAHERQDGRPLVIELAGPAGAGKTSVARLLRGGDATAGAEPVAGRVRLAGALSALLPRLAAARLSAPGRFWSRDELRSLGYLSAWQSRLKRGVAAGGLVVLDHGPVFRLASLTVDGPPMTGTRAFTRLWERRAHEWGDLLDVVVWLDAPDAVLLQRIAGRKQQHRIKAAAPAEAEAFLARYRAAYHTTLAAVTRGRTRLVELDTGVHRPDELAAEIRAAVLGAPSRWSSSSRWSS